MEFTSEPCKYSGADTNSAFLEGFTLFMIMYPNVQEKIYCEIQQHIPTGHEITMDDRKNMIYTQAALLEVHRHQKVIQNLVPRRVMDDFFYKDQLIKKGSILVPDLTSAYMSKTLWDDPEEFRPERFIGANGEIIKQNNIMPFGAGKRLCPGETLSAITSFLYVTSILRRYKIQSIPGNAAQKEAWMEGLTTVPMPFKTIFSKRN